MAKRKEPNSQKEELKQEASKRFTIRVPLTDYSAWEQYLEKNSQYDNMSEMIKDSVNDKVKTQRNKLVDQIVTPVTQKIETTLSKKLKDLEFPNDNKINDSLQTITNLLNLVLKNQKMSQVDFIETVEKSIPTTDNEFEALISERTYELLSKNENRVSVDDLVKYLKKVCPECKRYIEEKDREGGDGGYWKVYEIWLNVYNELFESTGNKSYDLRAGGIK